MQLDPAKCQADVVLVQQCLNDIEHVKTWPMHERSLGARIAAEYAVALEIVVDAAREALRNRNTHTERRLAALVGGGRVAKLVRGKP